MTFDNSKFNENVKSTTNALDGLDEKLGVLEKNDAINKMSKDMSGLASTFSKSGTIMFGVLNRLGSELVSFGRKLASSLTSGIRDGLAEYNLQIDSTQTILSNVKDEGKGINDVTNALDELNRYADMTIYNFSEMTRNIGMFTAAGTKLDTSVSTIKGLANAAAIVGANSQTAARAWYQVSQAMAAGTFKLMDWRSLEVSNIAGEQFQEVIKEVARATKATDKHGKNIDQMIKKYGSLRDTLKEGWLTAGRFSEAMSILSGDIDDTTLIKKGYTQKQIKKLRQIADEAMDAATAVKTFKQLVQTVAETIGSGWAETFRIMIGDIEEAKSLFTGINNILSDFIEKGQIIRKFLIKKIFEDDGAKNKLKDVFDNALTSFSALYRALRAGWMNIFSIDRIRGAAKKMIDFMTKTSEALTLNQKTEYAALTEAERKEKGLTGLIKTSKWNQELVTKAIENVVRIGRGAASAIDIVWSTLKQLTLFIINKIPFFRDFYKNLKEGNEGLLSSVGKVADTITTIRNMIVNEQLITKLLEAVNEKIKSIVQNNPALQMLISFVKWIRGNVKNALTIIKNIDFSGVIKALKDIKTIIKQILNVVISKDVFDAIVNIMKMILGIGKNILSGSAKFLTGFAETIKETDARTKDLLSTTVRVTAAFIILQNLIKKIPSITRLLYRMNIPQMFRYITKFMKAKAFVETSEAMRNVAIAIGILSISLIALSVVPFDTLIQRLSLVAVSILMFVLAIKSLGASINIMDDVRAAVMNAFKFLAIAAVFASVSTSLLAIVGAMTLLKKVFPNPKELGSYIRSLIVLLLSLAAAVFLITKAIGSFELNLGGIIKLIGVKSIMTTVVGSILALTLILSLLASVPEEKLAKAITAMVAISLIITGMVGSFSLLSGLRENIIASVLALGAIASVLTALTYCITQLSLITAIPNTNLYESVGSLTVLSLIVVGLTDLIGKINIASNIGNISKNILIMGGIAGLIASLSLVIAQLSLVTAIPNVSLLETVTALGMMAMIVVGLTALVEKIDIVSGIVNISKNIAIMYSIAGLVAAMSVVIMQLSLITAIPNTNLFEAVIALGLMTSIIVGLTALIEKIDIASSVASIVKNVAIMYSIVNIVTAISAVITQLALITAIPNVNLYATVTALGIMSLIVIGLSALVEKIDIASNIGSIIKNISIMYGIVGLISAIATIISIVSVIPKNNLEQATKAIGNSILGLIAIFAAITIASKYIQNSIGTIIALTGLIVNLISLVGYIAIIALIFKQNEVSINEIGAVAAALSIAFAAMAISVLELVALSKIIQKNGILFAQLGTIFTILGGALGYISIIAAELVLMAIALRGVSWNAIAKSASVFAMSIGSIVLIIKAFSGVSAYIKSVGSLASFAALAGLSSSIISMITIMAIAVSGVAMALKDVSWLQLAKSGTAFLVGSTIFISVLSAMMAISKYLFNDRLSILSFLATSGSINTFIISMSLSLSLIASSIKKLSNVNINSNTIGILKMYMIIIGVFIGLALMMQKMPKKLTFNFLSLSLALVLLSVFAESLARTINGMLRYSEEMPEMGEKIGVSIGNFCLGIANTLRNAIPAIVKSIVDILYIFVKSLWSEVPKIAETIGLVIATVFELSIKIATTKVKLSNGKIIHTGLILELFGINKIIQILTGKSLVARLAAAFGYLLKAGFVSVLQVYGMSMASSWGQILSVVLWKLGLFGEGVAIVNGQVQLSMKAMATAAGNLLVIGAAAVVAFGVASAAAHAWRQYTKKELSYNNADINDWHKAIEALFTDSKFRAQTFFNTVFIAAKYIAVPITGIANVVYTIINFARIANEWMKKLGLYADIAFQKVMKALDPLHAKGYDKIIGDLEKKLEETEDKSNKLADDLKNSWKIWWDFLNPKNLNEGVNWGEWYSGTGEQAGENLVTGMETSYMSYFPDFSKLVLGSTSELFGKQEKIQEEFNFEEYKNKYGLTKAILKLAEQNKEDLIGLNKEQAKELLKQKIFEATNNAEVAAAYSQMIIDNLIKEKIGEQVVTEETAKSLVQTEADTTATIIDIREYGNRRLKEQLEDEYRMKKEEAYRSGRLRELEAKGLANLNTAEREEYKALIKQKELFNEKSKKFLSNNSSTYDRARIQELQNKGMSNLNTAEIEEYKALMNRINNATSSSGNKSSSGNFITDMFKQIEDMFNKNKAGDSDTSLFNADALKKLLEGLNKKTNAGGGKIPKNNNDAVNKAKDLKTDLEKERADLTPVIDLDKLASDANKASNIVTTSLLAAQNAAIGDYINSDSELNPFMKDRWQNVYNFTQNNYSPKALSRIDIYRQTQRQLSMSRGF